jgi:hypothetical protein
VSSPGPGDTVLCHLKGSTIVATYDPDYDTKRIFDVVALYNEGYLLYVPIDIVIDGSVYITAANCSKYNTHKRFIDSAAVHVSDFKIVRVCSTIDGMCCIKCEQFYSMSSPNQEDGTLLCWSCRMYPHYGSSAEDD